MLLRFRKGRIVACFLENAKLNFLADRSNDRETRCFVSSEVKFTGSSNNTKVMCSLLPEIYDLPAGQVLINYIDLSHS
jgi:hypothetical protein